MQVVVCRCDYLGSVQWRRDVRCVNASTEREKWSRESSGVVGAVAATEDIMLRGNSMVNIPSWVHFYQCKR